MGLFRQFLSEAIFDVDGVKSEGGSNRNAADFNEVKEDSRQKGKSLAFINAIDLDGRGLAGASKATLSQCCLHRSPHSVKESN